MKYFYCRFLIRIKNHENYHHVILTASQETDIPYLLDAGFYRYERQETVEIDPVTAIQEGSIFNTLLMDGESLRKRLKKSFNNNSIHHHGQSKSAKHHP